MAERTVLGQIVYDLNALHEKIWGMDIPHPSPSVPEYVEWHENCKKLMAATVTLIGKYEDMQDAEKNAEIGKAKPETMSCPECGNTIHVLHTPEWIDDDDDESKDSHKEAAEQMFKEDTFA